MLITFLIAVLAVQLASRQLVACHPFHDEYSSAPIKTVGTSGFTYPAKYDAVCNSTTLVRSPASSSMTKNADIAEIFTLAPSSSVYLERNAIYKPSLVASTRKCTHYGPGMPGPSPSSSAHVFPALASQSPAPTPRDHLWPTHWLSLRLSNNVLRALTPLLSSNLSVALLSTNSEIIPNLIARIHPSAKQSPTVVVTTPITVMSVGALRLPQANAVALQSMHNSVRDGTDYTNANVADLLDSVYFGPTDVLTSTIHITVTATPPTTSSVKESTVASIIMSTFIKTVTLLLTTQQLSTTQPFRTSNPTTYLLGSPEPVVHMSIVSADPRCPYPFPGIYCGKPKTTLVTETRIGEAFPTIMPPSTMQTGEPKGDGWCPYPGRSC